MTQNEFSSDTHPTLWKTLPVLEVLQTKWEHMAKQSKYIWVCDSIEKGLHILKKYYQATDKTTANIVCLSLSLCLCDIILFIMFHTALNPNIKMAYFQKHWDPEWVDLVREVLEDVVSLPCLYCLCVYLNFFFQFDKYFRHSVQAEPQALSPVDSTGK